MADADGVDARRRSPAWLAGTACVGLTAAAFYVSTGLGEWWLAAWLAPIPILMFSIRRSSPVAFAAATVAFFAGGLNMFSFLLQVMPPAVIIGLMLVPSLAFGGSVALTTRAARVLPAWAAALLCAAAWTSFEFLLSLVSPHGTAGSIAYSQASVPTVLQVAAVAGLYAITFLLIAVPASVALACHARAWHALIPAVVLLTGVLAYGTHQLRSPRAGHAIRVGLAVTDHDIGRVFETTNTAEAMTIARAYAGRISRLARAGASVVVLPEKLTGVTPDGWPQVSEVVGNAARDAAVVVVAGFNRVGDATRRNTAMVFAPDGSPLVEYDKHHMLPGPETGYAAGQRPGVFQAAGVRWGVAICKDMDFQAWSRRYGQARVAVMAVPAWDFVTDGRLHARMALVRSVENGFAMARAAEQGLLTISDANGRVVAEISSGSGPEALLVADVVPGPGGTIYRRTGPWFGWLTLTGFLTGLWYMAAETTRAKRAAPQQS